MGRPVKMQVAGGPGKPEGLVKTLDRLAGAMAEGRAWMDTERAAAFLDLTPDQFRKIAPRLPRHEIPQDSRASGVRRRYRYYAPEITEAIMRGDL